MKRRVIAAWSLYDFANSAFTTLVVTFIFSAYFTRRIAPDPTRGTVLWTHAVNVSALVVALATPLLGALADAAGRKKRFLLAATLVCVGFTAALFFTGPGTTTRALVLFVVANVGFETANVFYNAFLPEIADRDTMGRISGIGWALGYAGGLACLVIALAMIRGWLGVAGDTAVRATNLLVAGWFLLFALPLFWWVPEPERGPTPPFCELLGRGIGRLGSTLSHLRRHRDAATLLLARLIYNDGLVTVFSLAAIFAAAAFGMTTDQLVVMGIAINISAAVGALILGFVNDRIGGRRTIAITLVVLIAATLAGALSHRSWVFWIAALAVGFMAGPNQAASRSLLATFIPGRSHAEFFGFFAFSGKLASVAGPLTYGLVLGWTGSQRLAMGSIAVFFAAGLLVLLRVDEARGIALAQLPGDTAAPP